MAPSYPRYTPKVVLITGSTGGFGQAFARKFASIGAKLVLHGRNAEKLAQLTSSLRQIFPDVDIHEVVFEITNKEAIKNALDQLPDEFHAIDVLINNAGGALGLDKAYEAEMDDWDTMIDVNVKSLARMTRFVIEGMAHRKRGHVINIGSTAGNYPYPGGNVYCAVKAFVKQFSLSLRADLAGTHIRVTNLEPGMAETQFSTVRFKGDVAKGNAVYANTVPLSAEDVAEAAFWVATLPPHVNVNRLEIMPTAQAFGPLTVERNV